MDRPTPSFESTPWPTRQGTDARGAGAALQAAGKGILAAGKGAAAAAAQLQVRA
jgi:hypothetical protein